MYPLLKVLLLIPIGFKTDSKPLQCSSKTLMIPLVLPISQTPISPTTHPDLLFCFSCLNKPTCSCLGVLAIYQFLRLLVAHHPVPAYISLPQRTSLTTLSLPPCHRSPGLFVLFHYPVSLALFSTLDCLSMRNSGLKAHNQSWLHDHPILYSCIGCLFILLYFLSSFVSSISSKASLLVIHYVTSSLSSFFFPFHLT